MAWYEKIIYSHYVSDFLKNYTIRKGQENKEELKFKWNTLVYTFDINLLGKSIEVLHYLL
jgi:hypothetical protein